jgi:hypothetical protein
VESKTWNDLFLLGFTHDQLNLANTIRMPEVYAAPADYAFPRNFKGYGEKGLQGLKWPSDARIAVSFVINYEEASEPLQRLTPLEKRC